MGTTLVRTERMSRWVGYLAALAPVALITVFSGGARFTFTLPLPPTAAVPIRPREAAR